MRQIKFRAFDKYKGIMSKPFSFNQVLNFNYKQIRSLDYDSDIIMQFTGLKDKNGKDIYDGDILNHPNAGNFEVRFEDFGFYLFYNGFKQNGHTTDYMEVVGNIHENSELCTA